MGWVRALLRAPAGTVRTLPPSKGAEEVPQGQPGTGFAAYLWLSAFASLPRGLRCSQACLFRGCGSGMPHCSAPACSVPASSPPSLWQGQDQVLKQGSALLQGYCTAQCHQDITTPATTEAADRSLSSASGLSLSLVPKGFLQSF